MQEKKYFGVMLDMSRNGVMKVEKVKEFVDYISKMGYNMLQLYTEETYEVNNEPYFGYMRGGYSKQDLKEIDNYCALKGVELVPCIQTLAHLDCVFHWKKYDEILDMDDILLIDDDRTYTLIDNIFATLKECFSTNRVHIGMDEAHNVGLGKYLAKHGFQNRFEIISKHLNKVVEIAKKYGFKPMMWSDMFFRLATGGEYYGDAKITEEIKNCVPKEIELVYWDYYHEKDAEYKKYINSHKEFNNNIWFAGGIYTWTGFSPINFWSKDTMTPAMRQCKKYGIDNIIITAWGDDGAEASYFSILPMLYYIKQQYDGVKSIKNIKENFKNLMGEDYQKMIDLELPTTIFKPLKSLYATRYLVYSDIFNFPYGDWYSEDTEQVLLKTANKFERYAKNSKFNYVYDYEAKLMRFLSIKFNISFKIRKAYKEKNFEEIKLLIKRLEKLLKYFDKFYYSFRNFWYTERNTTGFDVADVRLGGVKQRIISCKERLQDLVDGKIDKIEELEFDLLEFNGASKKLTFWRYISTQNRIW